MHVVDSSVVLAVLNEEEGASETHLVDAYISTVNTAEIAGKLYLTGYSDEEIKAIFNELPLFIEEFSHADAILTGSLAKHSKHLGLSLGDRTCIALGIRKNLPVLTADRIWEKLDLDVEIQLIR